MEESTFVEVWFSRGEIPALQWSKTIQNWMHWRGKEEQFDLTCINPPQGGTAQFQEPFLACGYSCECSAFPSVQDAAKEAHFSLVS